MYRAAVIGLGWMGLLYDLASRIGDRFEIDDIDRPTPPLDIHRKFHHYDHPGDEATRPRTPRRCGTGPKWRRSSPPTAIPSG